MGSVLKKLQHAARRFGRRDEGSATIEALFWIPAFLAVFALMVDTSFIYHNEARIHRIVQDANRNFSITRFDTASEVEAAIRSRLAAINIKNASISASIDENTTTGQKNAIITTVVVPANQLQMVGLYGSLVNSSVTVVGVHIAESAEWDFFDSFASVPTT